VDVAHELVSITSSMLFGSLNLSHAVMVLAYECWLALLAINASRTRKLTAPPAEGAQPGEAKGAMEPSAAGGSAGSAPDLPLAPSLDAMPATFSQTEALFARVRLGLDGTSRFEPERAQTVYPKLHNMLLRLRPSAAEVRLLHGVVRAVFGQPADLRRAESAAESTAKASPASTDENGGVAQS
jgi:tRNA C32,U32 (ribose-2'-O)-methylase TrmJ